MAVNRDLTVTRGVKTVLNQHAARLDELVADVETLRAKLLGALTKLDADAGITDTDYLATWTPGATVTSTGKSGDTIAS